MKHYVVLALALVFSIVTIGCGDKGGDEVTASEVALEIISPPEDEAAGGIQDLIDGILDDTTYSFTLELVITDADGNAVVGLPASNFSADAPSDIQSVASGTTDLNGPYSAALLLDESGSMRGTDPFDLRVEAAKTFFDLVNAPHNAALFAFAGSGDRLLDDMVVPFSPGYVTSIDVALVDTLKDLEGGWSPLFDSAHLTLTDLLAAPNANRSLIILSDGDNVEPNGSTYGGYDVTRYATDNDISIHTIGLSEDANGEMLAFLADATGGTYTIVPEAAQLNAAMSSLAAVLRGSSEFYSIAVEYTADTALASGEVIEGVISVVLFDDSVVEVPFFVEIP